MKTGLRLKKKAKFIMIIFNFFLKKRKSKVFCISMQRTGTTSCGQFLKDHGYRVASYGEHSRRWTNFWIKGDYDRIFRSIEFRSFQAYEDNPWWMPDFYQVLNIRFPSARFILFYRDSNKWFDSMLSHSGRKTLGNTYRHCKVYRRLDEFYKKLDTDPGFKPSENEIDNLMSLKGKCNHYIKVYEEYNREVIEYFNKYAPNKLFVCKLEDDQKWQKLGKFLNIKVDKNYNVHVNKSINF